MRTDYRAIIDTLLADLEVDQTGLAAQLGTTQGTVSRWRNGMKPSVDWAQKIDALYQRTYGQPENASPGINVIKIVGRVGAGAEIMPEYEQVPPEGLYEVELDFPVREGALAFEVEGDSMWPRCSAGDVIICWDAPANLEEAIGWEAAVQTLDGRRFVKIVRRGYELGTFNLESHNAPPLQNVKIKEIRRVNLIVPRSGWRAKPRAVSQRRRRIVR